MNRHLKTSFNPQILSCEYIDIAEELLKKNSYRQYNWYIDLAMLWQEVADVLDAERYER